MNPPIKKKFPTINSFSYNRASTKLPWPIEPLAEIPSSPLSSLFNENAPFAQWNLGGAFSFNRALITIFCLSLSELNKSLNIQSIHGCPPCAWNIEWNSAQPLMNPEKIRYWLTSYIQSEMNIEFILDFNNPFIPKHRLRDIMGNWLLECLTQISPQQKKAISVANEALAQHIRTQFPQIPLHASLNKIITEKGQGDISYYTKLLDKYTVIALHPADALNLKFMSQLPEKTRFEITTNDTCLQKCPVRYQHLAALSKVREDIYDITPLSAIEQYLQEASCTRPAGLHNSSSRDLSLSETELKSLHDMGFRRFRVQADTLHNEITYIQHLLDSLFSHKPELHHLIGFTAKAFSMMKIPPLEEVPSGLSEFVFKPLN